MPLSVKFHIARHHRPPWGSTEDRHKPASDKWRLIRQGGDSGRFGGDGEQRGVEAKGFRPGDEILDGATERSKPTVLRNGRFIVRDSEGGKQHPEACRPTGLFAGLVEMRNYHRMPVEIKGGLLAATVTH